MLSFNCFFFFLFDLHALPIIERKYLKNLINFIVTWINIVHIAYLKGEDSLCVYFYLQKVQQQRLISLNDQTLVANKNILLYLSILHSRLKVMYFLIKFIIFKISFRERIFSNFPFSFSICIQFLKTNYLILLRFTLS